jgi:hypothetical protein
MLDKRTPPWRRSPYQFRLVFYVAAFMLVVGVVAWFSSTWNAPDATPGARLLTVVSAWVLIPLVVLFWGRELLWFTSEMVKAGKRRPPD